MAKPFMSGYRTYDTRNGYGNPREWRAVFNFTMGEAKRIVGDASPWEILGIAPGSALKAIKSAYRRMAMLWHPDRATLNGISNEVATKAFKRISAAYTILNPEGL